MAKQIVKGSTLQIPRGDPAPTELIATIVKERVKRMTPNNPMTKKIAAGVIHEVPPDIEKALLSDAQILTKWNNLTPIQRNEWICWTTIVKKPETRAEHIECMVAELKEGKRQPCCWPGCPHRRPKAKKWFKKS